MDLCNISKFVKQINTDINKYKQTNTLGPQSTIVLNMITETITKQLGVIEYMSASNTEKYVKEIHTIIHNAAQTTLPLIKPIFVPVPISPPRLKRKRQQSANINFLNKSFTMYWKQLYVSDYNTFNNKTQIKEVQFLHYANHKLVKYNKFAPTYCILSKDGCVYTRTITNNLVPYYISEIQQKWQYNNKFIKN